MKIYTAVANDPLTDEGYVKLVIIADDIHECRRHIRKHAKNKYKFKIRSKPFVRGVIDSNMEPDYD